MEPGNSSKERSSVKGFGAKLKAEREAREITIEEISRVTKISPHLLQAMEQDRWEELPGGIFTRNFIRLYAGHLGLESEKLVDEFQQFMEVKTTAERPEEKRRSVEEELKEHEPNYTWMYVAFAVTVILLIAGFILINNIGSGNTAAVNNTENQSPAGTSTSSSTTPTTPQDTLTTEKREEGLTIELIETSRPKTWFNYRPDDKSAPMENGDSLIRDESRILTADEYLWLQIVSLKSVDLYVNGKKMEWSRFEPREHEDENGVVDSYIVEFRKEEIENME